MPRASYKDISVLHKYLDHITKLINTRIQDEDRSIVIACQVFQDFITRRGKYLVKTEEDCIVWLERRAKTLADLHLHRLQHEKIKAAAIRDAIHDYPSSRF